MSTKSSSEQKLNQMNKINLTSDKTDLVTREFIFFKDKQTLCISGLGMLVFKNVKSITVLTDKHIQLDILPHNII